MNSPSEQRSPYQSNLAQENYYEMENKLISEGKCCYCDEMVPQSQIIKHLKKHLSAIEKERPRASGKAYHLNIQVAEMFLQVLVKGTASFDTLDTFLREVWVECCDHMSGFHHKDLDIEMSDKFDNVLSPRLKFDYDYDYGSTTSCSIQVAGLYQISQKQNLVLLSRNEPLKIICRSCNAKPATSICTVHMYETDEYIFCDECAAKHEDECEDFLDYANLPVVNSPRMGICGYAGGSIDVERDGPYRAKSSRSA